MSCTLVTSNSLPSIIWASARAVVDLIAETGSQIDLDDLRQVRLTRRGRSAPWRPLSESLRPLRLTPSSLIGELAGPCSPWAISASMRVLRRSVWVAAIAGSCASQAQAVQGSPVTSSVAGAVHYVSARRSTFAYETEWCKPSAVNGSNDRFGCFGGLAAPQGSLAAGQPDRAR